MHAPLITGLQISGMKYEREHLYFVPENWLATSIISCLIYFRVQSTTLIWEQLFFGYQWTWTCESQNIYIVQLLVNPKFKTMFITKLM